MKRNQSSRVSVRDFLAIPLVLLVSIFLAQTSHTQNREIPRADYGAPLLQGTWDNGSGIDFIVPELLEGDSICVSNCQEASSIPLLPPDRPNYKLEFKDKVADLNKNQVTKDPVLRCFPPGLPRIGPPDKIIQQRDLIVFLYEDVTGNYFRLIPLNSKTYRDDVEEAYMGDSIGYWDNDTLIIETKKFTENTWLTDDGSFHTKNLTVTEKITRSGDMIEWNATAYDPEVLSEPWQLRPRSARLTDLEMAESPPCIERDLEHMEDMSSHDNPR